MKTAFQEKLEDLGFKCTVADEPPKAVVPRLIVATLEHVLVDVPKRDTKYFRHFDPFEVNGENVPERWQQGRKVGDVILNLHFYGFSEEDFGKAIPATVKVIEKKCLGDRWFRMLDITKECGEIHPIFFLDIVDLMDTAGISYQVRRTGDKFISFKLLQ